MTDLVSSQKEEIQILQEHMRRQQSTREEELKLKKRESDYKIAKDALSGLIKAWDHYNE